MHAKCHFRMVNERIIYRRKVVLAYSGGLDTSVASSLVKGCYNCEVIAMCANLGQADELDGLEEKALNSDCFKSIY